MTLKLIVSNAFAITPLKFNSFTYYGLQFYLLLFPNINFLQLILFNSVPDKYTLHLVYLLPFFIQSPSESQNQFSYFKMGWVVLTSLWFCKDLYFVWKNKQHNIWHMINYKKCLNVRVFFLPVFFFPLNLYYNFCILRDIFISVCFM